MTHDEYDTSMNGSRIILWYKKKQLLNKCMGECRFRSKTKKFSQDAYKERTISLLKKYIKVPVNQVGLIYVTKARLLKMY